MKENKSGETATKPEPGVEAKESLDISYFAAFTVVALVAIIAGLAAGFIGVKVGVAITKQSLPTPEPAQTIVTTKTDPVIDKQIGQLAKLAEDQKTINASLGRGQANIAQQEKRDMDDLEARLHNTEVAVLKLITDAKEAKAQPPQTNANPHVVEIPAPTADQK